MNKKIVACFMLVALLCATGCGGIFPTGCFPSCGKAQLTDKEYAIQMQEKVVAVLKTRDKAALKALFTEDAVTIVASYSDDTSIDVQIDNFFDWFQGEIMEWRFGDTGVVYDAFGSQRYKTIRSHFFIYVNGQEHLIHILDCPINSEHQNIGLFSLVIILPEEFPIEGEGWNWWPVDDPLKVDRDVAGIYLYKPEVEVE